MAKICQVTGKKANAAKHIRHRHSGAWKFRAPKKHREQLPNLRTVRIQTPGGKVTLQVSAAAMRHPEFQAVAAGLKPIPKEWLKKPRYE